MSSVARQGTSRRWPPCAGCAGTYLILAFVLDDECPIHTRAASPATLEPLSAVFSPVAPAVLSAVPLSCFTSG